MFSGLKKGKRISGIYILSILTLNSIFSQIEIDSFVNVYSPKWGEHMQLSRITKADTTKKGHEPMSGAVPAETFKVKGRIPTIGYCNDYTEEEASMECTEEILSKVASKFIYSLESKDLSGVHQSIRCRLRIGKTGSMEAFEVITQLEAKLENAIIEAIGYLREAGVQWTPQSSRSRIIAVDIYFTVNLIEMLKGERLKR